MIPYLTVRQNILLPLKLKGVSRSARLKQTEALIAAVSLTHRADNRPHTLSGGEQQRAGIAIALANGPGLLLADEPTGAVDSITTSSLMQLFRRLVAEYGLTIVMVTHDLDLLDFVDRAIAIKN
jgi:ABC-type lipoprotein export system ATPase subunit